MRPYSQACENNKQPILKILRRLFADRNRILEIGSGTGQHAVYFAEQLPHLYWQTSDRERHHDGIRQWIVETQAQNIGLPISLDVTASHWPQTGYDGVFSANTAHIMSWEAVEKMFHGVADLLCEGDVFALYGPFNRDGAFTSPSNYQFHCSLVRSDPRMGLRDDRSIYDLARSSGLCPVEDNAMPANNRLLVFSKNHS